MNSAKKQSQKQSGVQKQQARLIHFALKQLAKPYKYGAKKHEIGKVFDCSSFTQYVYRRIGIELPRSTILQAECGQTIPARKKSPYFKKNDLQIGDLLFFKGTKGHFNKKFPNGIGHVIMYLGNGMFIHASGSGPKKNQKIKLETFNNVINRKDFQIAKRIIKTQTKAHSKPKVK